MNDPAASAAPAPTSPAPAANGGPKKAAVVALGLALVVAIGLVGYRLADSADPVDTAATSGSPADEPGSVGSGDGSDPTSDQGPPVVVESQPADRGVDVGLDAAFRFRFDKPIAEPTDVVVEIRNRGVVAPAAVDRSSLAVDPTGENLSFVLDRPMVPETGYSMAILGLRSVDGTAIRPVEITFTTAAGATTAETG